MRRRQASSDPLDSARSAGLRYVNDAGDGIRRVGRGRGFRYLRAGRELRDAHALARIRSLAIPPAWRDVWICPLANGHLQATGRDARGRKQYRYHPRWRAVRDETKYHRMIPFARALPRIRAKVERDLRKPGLPRDKVLATVVSLLETTLIRVGNDEYARANHSYGLTTLRDDHVDVRGSRLRFEFRGKSGKRRVVEVGDRRLARIVERMQSLPGHELFQYLDEDGQRRSIASEDVNAYLRKASGDDFTAKDFRTWAGTVLAALNLMRTHNVVRAIEKVAAALGNTPAVCRKCYVHPTVIESYRELGEMSDPEAAVLALLSRPPVAPRQWRSRPGSAPRASRSRSSSRSGADRGGRRA